MLVISNDQELEKSVEKFIRFFKDKLEDIDNTDFKKSKNIFQKILYVGLLDSLSRTTTYSKKEKNRERMISFIKYFSGWEHHERVSLPHLVRLLHKVPDPEFSSLRNYAFSLIDQWSPGHPITLDVDPSLTDVKKLWPSSISKPFEDITLEHLQHMNLFYKYRNNLVHELREPGYGMEATNDAEPFYLFMTHTDPEGVTWELVYPVAFYRKICSDAIDRLRQYYIAERLNPYTLCSFGTYWIDELNE